VCGGDGFGAARNKLPGDMRRQHGTKTQTLKTWTVTFKATKKPKG
jgi:hypothetical protein